MSNSANKKQDIASGGSEKRNVSVLINQVIKHLTCITKGLNPKTQGMVNDAVAALEGLSRGELGNSSISDGKFIMGLTHVLNKALELSNKKVEEGKMVEKMARDMFSIIEYQSRQGHKLSKDIQTDSRPARPL